ncbi:hypothetical protein ACRW9N_10920 [Listeria aquatica]|uniref:hypothetical protein n=1 Tax=Listeria aquatica TaxID=1494960 RepID=UPI003EFA325C
MDKIPELMERYFTKNAIHMYLFCLLLGVVSILTPDTLKNAILAMLKLLPSFFITYLKNTHLTQHDIFSLYSVFSFLLTLTSIWIAIRFFWLRDKYTNTIMHDIHYFLLSFHGVLSFILYLYFLLFSSLNTFWDSFFKGFQSIAILNKISLFIHFWMLILIVCAGFLLIKPPNDDHNEHNETD